MFVIKNSVCPGMPIQPSLKFVSKAKLYSLGWKGLPGTNTLAYFRHS